MVRPLGHDPGVARLEQDHLPLQVQLGAALDHVADGLVLAAAGVLRLARRLLLPESHREALAHSQVLLALSPLGEWAELTLMIVVSLIVGSLG